MFIEAFGFLNLFGDFFPIALSFLRNIPGAHEPRAALAARSLVTLRVRAQ